jgi:hypothetical protein
MNEPILQYNDEMRTLVENFIDDKLSADEFDVKIKQSRLEQIDEMAKSGHHIVQLQFSVYDKMLDQCFAFGALPKQFAHLHNANTSEYSVNGAGGSRQVGSFGERMRRAIGVDELNLSDYLNIVKQVYPANFSPVFHSGTHFALANYQWLREITEVVGAGLSPVLNIYGPATFLASADYQDGTTYREITEALMSSYARLIAACRSKGALQINLHEPVVNLSSADNRAGFSAQDVIYILQNVLSELLKLSVDGEERPELSVVIPIADANSEVVALLHGLHGVQVLAK